MPSQNDLPHCRVVVVVVNANVWHLPDLNFCGRLDISRLIQFKTGTPGPRSLRHPNAIKERRQAGRICVDVGCDSGLPGNVRGHQREACRNPEVHAPLQEIAHPSYALPGYSDAGARPLSRKQPQG